MTASVGTSSRHPTTPPSSSPSKAPRAPYLAVADRPLRRTSRTISASRYSADSRCFFHMPWIGGTSHSLAERLISSSHFALPSQRIYAPSMRIYKPSLPPYPHTHRILHPAMHICTPIHIRRPDTYSALFTHLHMHSYPCPRAYTTHICAYTKHIHTIRPSTHAYTRIYTLRTFPSSTIRNLTPPFAFPHRPLLSYPPGWFLSLSTNVNRFPSLLFSCCCARVDWTWSTVCGCYDGGWRCDQTCVEDALRDESLFYPIGTVSLFPHSRLSVILHILLLSCLYTPYTLSLLAYSPRSYSTTALLFHPWVLFYD